MSAHSFAVSVVKKLSDAGHTAYFAGGWVRDYLMRHPSDDIDIATSASVEQIQALFPKTIPVGVSFGIMIVVEGGHQFEVATFRKESGYLDGRRPTSIESASPKEDAQRRDFTINGMFWDPLKEELHDFVEGREDLKKGIIRAIGDPHKRFLEDRLRMMRAVRYSTRFNFPIEEATKQAILSHAPTLLPAVAMERVWQEFKKMSQFAHFDTGLIILHQLDLLPTIFPALKRVSTEEVKKRLEPVAAYPKNAPTIAVLLKLFSEHSLEMLLELCEYLKLSGQEKETVEFLYQAEQMLGMPDAWLSQLERIEWARFYAHPLSQVCIEIQSAHLPLEARAPYLKGHQARKESLATFLARIQSKNPVIRSDHLLKEGIAPGKKMGVLLKEAERVSINQGIEDPQIIIALLKNSPLWNT
jgi:poly(A) polymerase